VGCGRRDAQRALVRLRHAGQAGLAPATTGTGRSAYVHAEPRCIDGIMRGKLLARSLRANPARDEREAAVAAVKGWVAATGRKTGPLARSEGRGQD
jgi:predicted RNA-binding protein YlxR (DUF448 family)